MQNLYPLDRYALGQDPGFGQLTVTIGMYYRVTGDSTQNRGVQPDIRLPSAISVEDVGESSRDGALPWNRIRSAEFRRRALHALLDELQRSHDQRIVADPDFRYTLAEIRRDRRNAQREVRLAEPEDTAGRARGAAPGAAGS